MIEEIDALALKARLDAGDAPTLLDVREAFEVRIAALPGARHIPLGQLQHRVGELEGARDVVVFCHHGVRSKTGAWILMQAGIPGVRSLKGGIDAWSLQVEPKVARY